jgi:hypothetical protein
MLKKTGEIRAPPHRRPPHPLLLEEGWVRCADTVWVCVGEDMDGWEGEIDDA